MSKISKRSAASRKGWRTRKRMKAARLETIHTWTVGNWLEQPLTMTSAIGLIGLSPSQRLLPPNPFLEIGARK